MIENREPRTENRELMLVICKAILFVVAYLNRRYDLRLRVPAVDLPV